MIDIKLLEKVFLLKELDEQLLQFVANNSRLRHFEKDEIILHKGDDNDKNLYFLLDGKLQVQDIVSDGRQIGIAFLNPGMHFGELAVIDGQPRNATIVAADKSSVALLNQKYALKLLTESPIVALRIMKRMAQVIQNDNKFRSLLTHASANKRVFATLMYNAEQKSEKKYIIDNFPRQQELAIMANTSRETVSRALSTLKKKGLITKDNAHKKRLIIVEPQKLQQLIEESDE